MSIAVKPTRVPQIIAEYDTHVGNHTYGRVFDVLTRDLLEQDSVDFPEQIQHKLKISLVQMEHARARIGSYFHVSHHMSEVCISAYGKLNPEIDTWQADTLPSPTGFLVFEEPLGYGPDKLAAEQNGDPKIAALSWQYFANANEIFDLPTSYKGAGIVMTVYTDSRTFISRNDKSLRNRLSYMIPAQFSFTPIGNGVDELKTVKNFIYTVFEMMKQVFVVYHDEEDLAHKRAQRKFPARKRMPSKVTVITLRRVEYQYEPGHIPDSGRTLNYRALTRGHWRRQHYGDGSVQRIYIHPYWRGPEDAPLYQPQRVSSLRR